MVLAVDNATDDADRLEFRFSAVTLQGPNPAITPWGREWGYTDSLWRSPDIWFDIEPPAKPGPKPDPRPARLAGQKCKLFARVRNVGNAGAKGVRVRFSYAPWGIGLADRFYHEVGFRDIDLAASGDPGGEDVKEVSVPWDLTDLKFNNHGLWDVPATSAVEGVGSFDHFCVRVEVEFDGDIDPSNNAARSSFARASLTSPWRSNILLCNPSLVGRTARVSVSTSAQGWAAKIDGRRDGESINLDAQSVRIVPVEVIPPAAAGAETGVSADVSLSVDGEKVGGVSLHLAYPGKPGS